jgi:flagellar motility protein MotE (MotC chaperone)
MKLPRLLPLIAVALGGVLALNALAGADSMDELFSGARAFAEDAVAKVAPKAAEEKAEEKAASPVPEGRILDDSLASKPQGLVCPADLASQAGLSSNELQFLQALGQRRTQIEGLEKNVDVQQQLLLTAEAKVDAKIATLRGLIGDMQKLLGEADAKQKADTARLVKIYEGMKPKDAAAAMAILEEPVKLDIAANMKERALSAILQNMTPPQAKAVTEGLARRYAASAAVKAAQDAVNPQPTQTAAAPQPKAPAPKAAPPRAPAPKAAAPKQAPAAQPKQAAATPPAAAPAAPPTPAAPAAEPQAKSG